MSHPAEPANNGFSVAIDRITSFFHFVAMVTISIMACLLIFDVVMRYVFNNPTDWVLDVVQLVQVTLAFAASAPVLRDGGHINMELLQSVISTRMRLVLEMLSNAICAGGSFWMSVLGWRTFTQSYMISESSYGITLPIYPWKFLVPLCFLVLGMQFSGMLITSLCNMRSGGRDNGRASVEDA